MELLKNAKVSVLYRGSTALAAADVDSTTLLDMSGYDGVMLMTSIVETTAGASTTAVILMPRHAATNNSTALTELGSTAAAGNATVSTGDWGKALVVDIYRPLQRYIGVSVNKTGAGTSMTSAVFAIQYQGHKAPVTQPSAMVYSSKSLTSPTT